MKKVIAIVLMNFLLILSFSGCASKISDIKKHPTTSEKFIIHDNYQRVYKRLTNKFHNCIHEGWSGAFANMHIDTELFTELGEARILYYMTNFGMKDYYIVIELYKIDHEQTKMLVYTSKNYYKNSSTMFKAWAKEDTDSCEAY